MKESESDEKYLFIFIENSGNVFIEEQIKDEFFKKYLTKSTENNWGSDFEVNLAVTKNLIDVQGDRILIELSKRIGNRYSYYLPIQKLFIQTLISPVL